MPKKKVIKSKRKKSKVGKGSYFLAQWGLSDAIHEVILLQTKALNNGDQIAQWALGELYEDLVKSSNRLGQIRLTVKGDRE